MINHGKRKRIVVFSSICFLGIFLCFWGCSKKGSPEKASRKSSLKGKAPNPDPFPEKLKNPGETLDNVKCPPENLSDTLNLHVFVKPGTKVSQKKAARLLENLGVKIVFNEFPEDTDYPLISIDITSALFKKKFKGKMAHRVLARSARVGFYCQALVESYVVPVALRPFIKLIDVPDPQMY